MATHSSRVTTCHACARQSGKRDSNPRHSPWQGDALPTELFPHCKKYNKLISLLQVLFRRILPPNTPISILKNVEIEGSGVIDPLELKGQNKSHQLAFPQQSEVSEARKTRHPVLLSFPGSSLPRFPQSSQGVQPGQDEYVHSDGEKPSDVCSRFALPRIMP